MNHFYSDNGLLGLIVGGIERNLPYVSDWLEFKELYLVANIRPLREQFLLA